MNGCTYERMYTCTFVRMYVRTYVRMHVYMYVCISYHHLGFGVSFSCAAFNIRRRLSRQDKKEINETDVFNNTTQYPLQNTIYDQRC